MQLGKQRTKQVEERWCHQGRSPRVCLPFSQTSCGGSPSLEALSWCETPFSTWVITTEDKEEASKEGRDRQTDKMWARSQRGRRMQTGGQNSKGTSGHGSEVKGDWR